MTMELYMCGFNAHHQLIHGRNEDVMQYTRICRSPQLKVRCALWSSTLIEADRVLMHRGFRLQGSDPIIIEGPPARHLKSIFGDTSGVLGALTTDDSLYVHQDKPGATQSLELKRHHFDEDSFIQTQNLAIDYIAIADNGEVCIITSKS